VSCVAIVVVLIISLGYIGILIDGRPPRIILLDTALKFIWLFTLPGNMKTDPERWLLEIQNLSNFDKNDGIDPETHGYRDVKIPLEGYDNQMRIFMPKNPPQPSGYPLFVWFHGGGFCLGNYSNEDGFLYPIREKWGGMVISIGYRLAPKYKFPIGINDAYNSLLWIVEHADEFNIDPNQIVVGGESAGASISIVMGIRSIEEHKIKFSGLYINCGGVFYNKSQQSAIDYAYGYIYNTEMSSAFRQAYVAHPDDLKHPYANLRTSTKGFPPVLAHVAELDMLRDGSLEWVDMLKRENGPDAVRLKIFPGIPHGGLASFRRIFRAESDEAIDELVVWMNDLQKNQNKLKIETKKQKSDL